MTRSVRLRDAIRVASDPHAVMDRVLEQALALVPAADGASLEVRVGDDELEYLAASGTLAPFVGMRLGLSTSLSGLAVRTGEPQRCDDTETDPRVDRSATRTVGARSLLCIPLPGETERVAVLKLSASPPGAFDAADVERVARLADFLRVTLGAAAELARVAAEALGDPDGPDDDGPDGLDGTARFVANVMRPGLVAEYDVRERIRAVLDRRAVTMVFQPIVDLHTGALVMVEALARFDPAVGLPPDRWFADADAVGMGVELELLAVDAALRALPGLAPDVSMTVNVGPDVVHQPELLMMLQRVDASRVVIELTEHVPVADLARVREALEALGHLGTRWAVDDAGSGYSSLVQILELRPDVVKVDGFLTHDLDTDPVRRTIVGALEEFADSLHGVVVAEGIETVGEADAAVDLGVRLGQGFLLARPAPLAALRPDGYWRPTR